MYALREEAIEESLADVSPVGKHLPEKDLGEDAWYALIPVINVGPREREDENLPAVVAQEV